MFIVYTDLSYYTAHNLVFVYDFGQPITKPGRVSLFGTICSLHLYIEWVKSWAQITAVLRIKQSGNPFSMQCKDDLPQTSTVQITSRGYTVYMHYTEITCVQKKKKKTNEVSDKRRNKLVDVLTCITHTHMSY